MGACVFNVPLQQLDLVLPLDQLCLLVPDLPFQISDQGAAIYPLGVSAANLFAVLVLMKQFINGFFLLGELVLKDVDTCAEFCVFILKKIGRDSLFHNVVVELFAILLHHPWSQLYHFLVD